jgi:hypothetical protein
VVVKIRYWDRVAVDLRVARAYLHEPLSLAILLTTWVLLWECVGGLLPWWVILIPVGIPLAGLTVASLVATGIAVVATYWTRFEMFRARPHHVGHPRSVLAGGIL